MSKTAKRQPTEDRFMLSLGHMLRERRKEKRLTLGDLCAKCGISIGYLSQVELAKNNCSIPTLHKILVALDITMSNFFYLVEAHALYLERRPKIDTDVHQPELPQDAA